MNSCQYTDRRRSLQFTCYLIATGFGSGYLLAYLRNILSFTRMVKPCSEDWWGGTSGSLAAIIVLAIGGKWGDLAMFNMVVVSFLIGVAVIPAAAWLKNLWDQRSGRKSTGHDGTTRDFDHRVFVIDEWHGIFISAWLVYTLDMSWFGSYIPALIITFALFRLFDGKKALGIKAIEARLDKFGKKRSVWWRAFAVMFDDTVAGLYTLVVMALVDFCVDGIVSYAIVA